MRLRGRKDARRSSRKLAARLTEIASLGGSVTLLDAPGMLDLEDLERRLTILDEKMHAALTEHAARRVAC